MAFSQTTSAFMAAAAAGPPERIFVAFDGLAQTEIGAIICTCTTFDMAEGLAWRVFSNQPDAYPLTTPKPITPNRWTHHVLDERKIFVANSLAEIRTVFPDHDVIGSLGCGSVVNLPVALSGTFLGTVNLLNETGYFTPERLERTSALLPAAMLAFASLTVDGTDSIRTVSTAS